jgi:hypothetical protein
MKASKSLYENVALDEIGDTIKSAETAVLALLQEEDRADERMAEIGALVNSLDRLEEGGHLWMECKTFIDRCKAIAETVKNASARVKEVQERLGAHLKKELDSYDKGKAQTSSWKFATRKNPDKVIVDDETIVPKKYRVEPPPPPPPDQWPLDKHAIKTALTKEHVQSIKGVHLAAGTRVDVKSR